MNSGRGNSNMKHVKRIGSLLLIVAIVLAMSVGVLADETAATTPTSGKNDNSGKITINEAVVGQKYDIYQVLELESYNTTAGAYAYKATTAWANFVASDAIKNVYLKTDDDGYVTWVGEDTAERAQEFAKLACEYAKTSSISATKSATATTTTTVEFTGLNLGYYLIDSTLGMLCSLDTTTPSVTMEEKNEVPTNAKQVEEDDATENKWGEKNDADIGQTVNFKSTITAQPGAENYVFYDTMSDGLTLKAESITVKVGETALTKDTDYTLTTTGLTDGITFKIEFKQTYLNSITEATTIVVEYSATLNENAVVAGEGNPNTSKLSYGDSSNTKYTPDSKTTTYTWPLSVYKYTEASSTSGGVDGTTTKTPLAGAKFKLSTSESETDAIAFVAKTGEGNANVYRRATNDESGTAEITTDATGKFKFEGLDSGTYYLIETEAPAGYNTLKGPIMVKIDNTGKVEYKNCTGKDNKDKYTYDENWSEEDTTYGVMVLNNTGAELPSTGGTGTTMIYIVGAALALLAVVLLVTRRRMSKNHEA